MERLPATLSSAGSCRRAGWINHGLESSLFFFFFFPLYYEHPRHSRDGEDDSVCAHTHTHTHKHIHTHIHSFLGFCSVSSAGSAIMRGEGRPRRGRKRKSSSSSGINKDLVSNTRPSPLVSRRARLRAATAATAWRCLSERPVGCSSPCSNAVTYARSEDVGAELLSACFQLLKSNMQEM